MCLGAFEKHSLCNRKPYAFMSVTRQKYFELISLGYVNLACFGDKKVV